MKTLIAVLVCSFSIASLAQMPSMDSLKNAGSLKDKALVNLNTASESDLQKLPGVGSRAKDIIAARPFKNVSDLSKVKGLNDDVVAKLKGFVKVK